MRRGDPDPQPSAADRQLVEAFRLLLTANPMPMWIYDLATLEFLEVNDAAVTGYGYEREWFLGHRITDIRPAEDLPRLLDNLGQPRPLVEASGGWRHRTADGRLLHVEVTSHPLTWLGRPAVLVAARDVSAQQRLEAALSRQALHDSTTGLPSASLFTERLAEALRRGAAAGQPVGVVAVGIDRLAELTSAVGFPRADTIASQAARRLLACCSADDEVGRLAGGQFAVCCVGPHADQAALRVATAVIEAFADPYQLPDASPVTLSTSVGVALAVRGETDPEDLLRAATAAMRLSSSRGGGHVELSHPELGQAALTRFDTEQALRAAIDGGQFELHYQPEVDLRTGQVVGLEALCRWRRPGHGLVPPAEFIDVAEDSGLILPLGQLVLARAITDAAGFPGRAPPTVAVNVSARQLADGGLVEQILDSCRTAGLPTRRLCVELTESALVADDDYYAYEALLTLRHLGAQIAIDDFGTGYSALGYLKRLPVDIVKIDRSFVTGLTGSATDAALVHAVITVAHAHGLTVIAEGVETPAQLDALRALGADLAQGFLFSRPVPFRRLSDAMRKAATAARPTAPGVPPPTPGPVRPRSGESAAGDRTP